MGAARIASGRAMPRRERGIILLSTVETTSFIGRRVTAKKTRTSRCGSFNSSGYRSYSTGSGRSERYSSAGTSSPGSGKATGIAAAVSIAP